MCLYLSTWGTPESSVTKDNSSPSKISVANSVLLSMKSSFLHALEVYIIQEVLNLLTTATVVRANHALVLLSITINLRQITIVKFINT